MSKIQGSVSCKINFRSASSIRRSVNASRKYFEWNASSSLWRVYCVLLGPTLTTTVSPRAASLVCSQYSKGRRGTGRWLQQTYANEGGSLIPFRKWDLVSAEFVNDRKCELKREYKVGSTRAIYSACLCIVADIQFTDADSEGDKRDVTTVVSKMGTKNKGSSPRRAASPEAWRSSTPFVVVSCE
jgi:hypothetical protein